MITEFTVHNAETVPENYSWDFGAPLQTIITTTLAYVDPICSSGTSPCVSGYAPGVRVLFYNNGSQSDEEFDQISYNWDFGDYYNDTNNFISLSCISLVEHTYVMPGTYTVSLRHIQSRKRTELDPSSLARLCIGKYSINWYWDNLKCGNKQALIWDQTMCNPPASAGVPRPKWWDSETQCFQKHCKFWSWYDLANYSDSSNPIKWNETITDATFEKLWMYEANETDCVVSKAQFLDTIETEEETLIKPLIVQVKEIPPVAEIACLTNPTGTSPHTVTLTPTGCKPGSFPIDRIDWDLGDGTPIITHTRYAPPSGFNIEYNGKFPSDPEDVRNYNITHIYTRNSKTYPIFYPSLTCYSANTNTQDSCSTTVGPITLPDTIDTKLIKARNTVKGNFYVFDVNKGLAFSTNTSITSEPVIPVTPSSRLLNTSTTTNTYFGNPNINLYPSIYIPSCTLLSSDILLAGNYLTTEDNFPEDEDTTVNIDENGIPIVTDLEIYIEP